MAFKRVEDDVRAILEYSEASRCSDMTLYASYVYEKISGFNYGVGWLEKVFSDNRFRIIHGIAPYDTVSRVRRKLQEKDEELRPTPEQIKEKKRIEHEYREYARKGGVNE